MSYWQSLGHRADPGRHLKLSRNGAFYGATDTSWRRAIGRHFMGEEFTVEAAHRSGKLWGTAHSAKVTS